MLHVLEVQNLALIDNLTFCPEAGLNVITGETGAGKSMLLGALSLLLGERATAEVIRSGEESALLQAVFTETEGGQTTEYIFSREIRRTGPNLCRLNGKIEPLSEMAACGKRLVDLHGQHKQQSLLEAATQRELLDAFGGEELMAARQKVSELYRQLQVVEKELEQLGGDEAAAARQADFLRFQLEEIAQANLSAAEEEELQVRFRRLSHARQLLENTARVYALLAADGHDGAVLDRLGYVEKELAIACALDETLSPLLDQICAAAEQLKDAASELRFYRENIELNDALLQETIERLEVYRTIKNKYGKTVADVEETAAALQAELTDIEGRGAKREKLMAAMAQLKSDLAKTAGELTKRRQKAATALALQITEALKSVALASAQFQIELQQVPCGPFGCDQVEFLLTTNMGEPLRPLAKTASGGEISRVMLAIKSVLAEQDAVETLIFDEIDAGIGGLTIRAVAEKLKQLAQHRQVICVTHQPVIAACADHQFVIFKEASQGRTVTRLKKLTAAEREVELARMLGGQDEIALKHARRLLATAKNLQ